MNAEISLRTFFLLDAAWVSPGRPSVSENKSVVDVMAIRVRGLERICFTFYGTQFPDWL